ncbi:MAG: family 20 glycosylhydrolase [Bacteroidota bacterium]|nr:family 20 glycosylhydrolase [Bacteroidota bacterium]
MRKLIFYFLACLVCSNGYSQSTNDREISIIPQPVSVSLQKGYFILSPGKTVISADKNSSDVASFLSQLLHEYYGFHIGPKSGSASVSTENTKANILLSINKKPDASIGAEGYRLKVNAQQIVLSANQPKGLFYGVQTLMQLLPPKDNPNAQTKNSQIKIRAVDVTDYPRFGYRGMMLDVSRHFFSKDFILRYIDEMAKYKFNVFHWHLTDDQGWRIEIKGLPKLTEVGGFRVPRTGKWGTFQMPQPGEIATDGGYYTQDDIREVIAYAKKRFIEILPEIDVPAHSLALIVSYPNLSCTKEQYAVSPQYTPDTIDDVLCVANDSTWLLLDKIFTQVAQLFPYEYIHTGGDEANRKFWTKDPKDVALMKKEGLKTPAELQSYFEKKLEKLIISKGKKMIGWDEIVEGGLAPEATVMSWRGMEGGIEAAKMGHEVIMTPILETYLSRKQGEPSVEPFGPGILRLSTCYQFEPVPDGLDPKFILGGQAGTWTEKIPDERHLEYLTWPRAMAIAEVLWSPKSSRNFPDFTRRVEARFKYLDADTLKYSRSMFDPIVKGVKGQDDSLKVVITTDVPGLTIYYTFDGTDPDNFYPKYEGTPLDIPTGTTEIRTIAYRNGQPISRQINYLLKDLKK